MSTVFYWANEPREKILPSERKDFGGCKIGATREMCRIGKWIVVALT